ncbi:MAG: hypothetical protein ACMUHX_09375 [bacterium]
MKKSRISVKSIIIGIYVISLIFFAGDANAQWIEQTITLKPGWNAIYLEVEPQPNQCDEVFKDLPIASVWFWNPKLSTVEYIKNPATLLPDEPQWLVYFPLSSQERVLSRLFSVIGGKAYLVKLEGDQPVNWTINGRPCMPKIQWKSNSYNYVGFHVTPGNEPFMGTFFSYSSAHAGQDIYRLNENDHWEKVKNPAITTMNRGEAYWVYCKGPSDYVGPIRCRVRQGEGLDYGRTLVEQEFSIQNLSNNAANITLDTSSSLNPPDPSQPSVAGDVRLLYRSFEQGGWTPLPASLSLNLQPGEERIIRLAAKRADMPATGLSQSILSVRDNNTGNRIRVPVTASGSGGLAYETNTMRKRVGEVSRYTGLWVGSAFINGVSHPEGHDDPDNPDKATASEFEFRLIVHVDSEGKATLLKEVIQMWKKGTWTKADPNDSSSEDIVDKPGYFVLFTDDSHINDPNYTGAGLRSGEPIGRRISSAAFSFSDPIDMQGSFSGGMLSCSILIDADAPTNPFKHKYHPDHNNLDEYWEKYKKESYDITRTINLEFTAHDPMILDKAGSVAEAEAAQSPGWGDTDMGGIYRETITGLHKSAINTKGYFYLHRVSPVALLNDGR